MLRSAHNAIRTAPTLRLPRRRRRLHQGPRPAASTTHSAMRRRPADPVTESRHRGPHSLMWPAVTLSIQDWVHTSPAIPAMQEQGQAQHYTRTVRSTCLLIRLIMQSPVRPYTTPLTSRARTSAATADRQHPIGKQARSTSIRNALHATLPERLSITVITRATTLPTSMEKGLPAPYVMTQRN
jgi:hypothetical protein